MGQEHDNPTLLSAEQATGLSPLNHQPSEPQTPQSSSMVKNPTLDTLPQSLSNLPSPFTPFVLALDTRDSREKTSATIDPASYPDSSKFEDLVKAGLKPEGPARAQAVDLGEVKWPAGFESVEQMVKDAGEGTKAFEVVMGVRKAEVFVVSVDLENERLVGVKFAKET